MNRTSNFLPDETRGAISVILILALVGAGLRLWNPGRLGLNHFDEGIYALAGAWSLNPGGLAAIDPGLIPYAPPGFPFLVGCAYWLLGPSDLAAISVSIALGTGTVVLVWLVGRDLFGSTVGVLAASIAAFSGPHIAFSRMALVDVSFTAVWLIAIWAGARFLQKPGGLRAFVLGIAVGLSMLFKYSGWVAGAIVVLAASAQTIWAGRSQRSRLVSVWAWGMLAAGIALLVYAPWLWFVQKHGGYSALLAHQRSYLGPTSAWPHHLLAQQVQQASLNGGVWRAVLASLATTGSYWYLRPGLPGLPGLPIPGARVTGVILISLFPVSEPALAAPLAVASLAWFKRERLEPSGAGYLLIAWLALAALTPFYHPYARLWLPVAVLEWLVVAVWLESFLTCIPSHRVENVRMPAPSRFSIIMTCLLLASAAGAQIVVLRGTHSVLEPTDSLRIASGAASQLLPRNGSRVTFLGRPSILYYLALAGVNLDRKANLQGFEQSDEQTGWGVIDQVMLKQEGFQEVPSEVLDRGWQVARMLPASITLPVRLDLDPASGLAEGHQNEQGGLLLLRKVQPGVRR